MIFYEVTDTIASFKSARGMIVEILHNQGIPWGINLGENCTVERVSDDAYDIGVYIGTEWHSAYDLMLDGEIWIQAELVKQERENAEIESDRRHWRDRSIYA